MNLEQLAYDAVAASRAHDDPDFPVFHLAPPVGRLNDPNGLMVAGGTYHAFFQFTPMHPERRLVYWGHSTSTDLTRWTDRGIAIVPDSFYDRNGAYSGTAIATDAGYELFYTGNLKDPVTDERTASQCVVTTPDLTSFTKLESNPVIPTHEEGYTAHYRDPQVWRDVDGSYRMLIGVQRENLTGAAVLYRSPDLREWTFEGEMSFPDAGGAFDEFGYMWECPNLVHLTDEVTGERHDVLVFCPQGIKPEREGFENIFPCVYIVGELDGTQFRGADGSFEEVDRGFEFYAPQIFARDAEASDGRALLLGWAGNASEDDQPSIQTGGWVHMMTAPRSLSLRNGRLIARPALDGLELADAPAQSFAESFEAVEALAGSRSWRLSFDIELGTDDSSLTVRIGSDACHVDIMLEAGRLSVDRSTTRYPHGDIRNVTLHPKGSHTIEIVHDRSLTEIFVDDGELAFTQRSFVDVDAAGARVAADGARVTGAKVARAD